MTSVCLDTSTDPETSSVTYQVCGAMSLLRFFFFRMAHVCGLSTGAVCAGSGNLLAVAILLAVEIYWLARAVCDVPVYMFF